MVATFAVAAADEAPTTADALLTEDGGIDLQFAGADSPLRLQGTLDDPDSLVVTADAEPVEAAQA